MLRGENFLSDRDELKKIQNLFNIFPVGMMIFEKIFDNYMTDFKLKYINETALKTLRKSITNSEEEIKKTLKKFKKLTKFSTVNEVYSDLNDVSEESLYNRIMDDFDKTETEICERYISNEIMIYVKIKIHEEYKLVVIENFNDERIAIQNNIIKNIKTQYLLTLSHELNNPLNSLSYSVNEINLKKDDEKEKKFVNGMKINIKLIKFFVKNFIFSVKISFDMNTIIQDSDKLALKNNSSCINLEYLLKKIKEKYSIFFRSKRIKLEINLNPVENIFVTYDYDYFNSMIKNIFMYLFYRVEREGGITIEFVFDKELKIMFKKSTQKFKNYFDQRLRKPQNHLDTSFVSELSIESSVKTLKILYDIIYKFAALLGIKLRIIEDESPCYLILQIRFDLDEDLTQIPQDIAEEYTNRESKKKNTNLLDRPLLIKGELNNTSLDRSSITPCISVLNPREETIFSDHSVVISNNYSKLHNHSFSSKGEKIQSNGGQRITGSVKSNKISKPKAQYKLSRYVTDYKNLKNSVTINSEREIESNRKVTENKTKPKTMFMRSNFTFKCALDSDNDVNMMIDLYFDKNNRKSNNSANVSPNGINFKDRKNSLNDISSRNTKKPPTLTTNNKWNNPKNVSGMTRTPTIKKVFLNEDIVTFKDSKITEAVKKLLPLTRNITKIVDLKNSLVNPIDSMHLSLINDPIYESSCTERVHPEILVVDDDNFNIIALQSMLKKLKLRSDKCMNGQECLDMLRSKYEKGVEYKLILMDVMMPIMDGIEASTRIEEMVKNGKLNKNIKIIVISAHNNQEIIKRATKLSVVAEFKSKPVKQTDIQGIIKNYYV